MTMRTLLLTGLVMLTVGAIPLWGQSGALPVAEMRQAIEEGVDFIISRQREDGSWFYADGKDAGRHEFVAGTTALCTLALRHSGLTRAIPPAQKGLTFVAQHEVEPLTYSSGLVEWLLYEAGARQYADLMSKYAECVIRGQSNESHSDGGWTYKLPIPAPTSSATGGRATLQWPGPYRDNPDNSNAQFAVLALYYANKGGYQVPIKTWLRVKEYYEKSQNPDGSWTYMTPAYYQSTNQKQEGPRISMTAANIVSLYLAVEALETQTKHECRTTPPNEAVQKGMDWMGRGLTQAGCYTAFTLERGGILTGRAEFGGKDWLAIGTADLLKLKSKWGDGRGGRLPNTALSVIFLSRALEPVRINKLDRTGDWNNDPYDIKHLTEYISEKYQNPSQWRIVTLRSSVEDLLRVPILYMNGHDALQFTDDEKAKLKAYVTRGGTIFGMACCGNKKFDQSFRDLVKELWPELELTELPKGHPLFLLPRPNTAPPKTYGMALNSGQGRLGVVYLPNDLCCKWHLGGKAAEPSYTFGVNLVYYVDVLASREGAVKAGYAETPAQTPAQQPQAEPATQPAPEPEPTIIGP